MYKKTQPITHTDSAAGCYTLRADLLSNERTREHDVVNVECLLSQFWYTDFKWFTGVPAYRLKQEREYKKLSKEKRNNVESAKGKEKMAQ